MRNFKTTTFILIAAAICGCSKDHGHSPVGLDGKYSGKLYAVYKTDIWHTGPITSNVNVSFTNGHYTSVSIPSPSAYGTYSGTEDSGAYSITGSQVNLQDPLAYPDLFDHALIMEGPYTVEQKADSLVLSETHDGNSYTYKLKKQ